MALGSGGLDSNDPGQDGLMELIDGVNLDETEEAESPENAERYDNFLDEVVALPAAAAAADSAHSCDLPDPSSSVSEPDTSLYVDAKSELSVAVSDQDEDDSFSSIDVSSDIFEDAAEEAAASPAPSTSSSSAPSTVVDLPLTPTAAATKSAAAAETSPAPCGVPPGLPISVPARTRSPLMDGPPPGLYAGIITGPPPGLYSRIVTTPPPGLAPPQMMTSPEGRMEEMMRRLSIEEEQEKRAQEQAEAVVAAAAAKLAAEKAAAAAAAAQLAIEQREGYVSREEMVKIKEQLGDVRPSFDSYVYVQECLVYELNRSIPKGAKKKKGWTAGCNPSNGARPIGFRQRRSDEENRNYSNENCYSQAGFSVTTERIERRPLESSNWENDRSRFNPVHSPSRPYDSSISYSAMVKHSPVQRAQDGFDSSLNSADSSQPLSPQRSGWNSFEEEDGDERRMERREDQRSRGEEEERNLTEERQEYQRSRIDSGEYGRRIEMRDEREMKYVEKKKHPMDQKREYEEEMRRREVEEEERRRKERLRREMEEEEERREMERRAEMREKEREERKKREEDQAKLDKVDRERRLRARMYDEHGNPAYPPLREMYGCEIPAPSSLPRGTPRWDEGETHEFYYFSPQHNHFYKLTQETAITWLRSGKLTSDSQFAFQRHGPMYLLEDLLNEEEETANPFAGILEAFYPETKIKLRTFKLEIRKEFYVERADMIKKDKERRNAE